MRNMSNNICVIALCSSALFIGSCQKISKPLKISEFGTIQSSKAMISHEGYIEYEVILDDSDSTVIYLCSYDNLNINQKILVSIQDEVVGKEGCKGYASVPTHDNKVDISPGINHPMLDETYFALVNSEVNNLISECRSKHFSVSISFDPAIENVSQGGYLSLFDLHSRYHAKSSIQKCFETRK